MSVHVLRTTCLPSECLVAVVDTPEGTHIAIRREHISEEAATMLASVLSEAKSRYYIRRPPELVAPALEVAV